MDSFILSSGIAFPAATVFDALTMWLYPIFVRLIRTLARLPMLLALFALLAAVASPQADAQPDAALRVGSKRFTESYVLGELIVETARRAGSKSTHRPGLGNTAIVYSALKSGSIDIYVEYTGTIAREILKIDAFASLADLNERLRAEGMAVIAPLGFNNTYALGMHEDLARARNVRVISDLARHADLRFGLSQEFIARSDGWPGLRSAYQLPHGTPPGLDHGLAYEALAGKRVDVIDLYSTDAKIARYGIRVLDDDRRYFPRYDAVLFYRMDLPKRFPQAWAGIVSLGGSIDERRMIALNAAVEIDGRSFAEAARTYFDPPMAGGVDAPTAGDNRVASRPTSRTVWQATFAEDLPRLVYEHLALSIASLALAVAIGIPLGVLAVRGEILGQAILGLSGLIQTIPSLALLALLIAAMGSIGFWPALVALSLYALLPIVRNTHAGLQATSLGLRQAALALGLAPADRLRHIELPLAWPTILAGIKISAVINVGMATIAAFVGAGGLGERIVQGLAVNDTTLLVAGAIPAAALAIAVQWGFELLERQTAPWRRTVNTA
ncbi:MAG: glycine betaine ABC transporter substrate-binding protein [Burkholderiales bacterium]